MIFGNCLILLCDDFIGFDSEVYVVVLSGLDDVLGFSVLSSCLDDLVLWICDSRFDFMIVFVIVVSKCRCEV